MDWTKTTHDTYDATKGQTICRPSEWQDVARFFLLNYGLHAFTIFLSPGTSGGSAVQQYAMSMLAPIYGVTGACRAIFVCARLQSNELQTALMSGALCMVVPRSTKGVMYGTQREWRVWIER